MSCPAFTLVVGVYSRFASQVHDHAIRRFLEREAGVGPIISLSESIDTSTPMGRMVFTVIADVAELERSLIRERVVMGLRYLQSSSANIVVKHGRT